MSATETSAAAAFVEWRLGATHQGFSPAQEFRMFRVPPGVAVPTFPPKLPVLSVHRPTFGLSSYFPRGGVTRVERLLPSEGVEQELSSC